MSVAVKVTPVEPGIAGSTSPVHMKLVMIQAADKFLYRIGPLSIVPSEIEKPTPTSCFWAKSKST